MKISPKTIVRNSFIFVGIIVAVIIIIFIAFIVVLNIFAPSAPTNSNGEIGYYYANKPYITKYPISDSKTLVVDTWDCGATCDYTIKVVMVEKIGDGKYEDREILNCYATSFEVSNITENSAVLNNVYIGENSSCSYKEGDTINF